MTDPDPVEGHPLVPGARGTLPRVRASVDAAPGWLRWLGVIGGLLVLVAILGVRFEPAHSALSRADEYVYVDAVDKATRGEVTRRGAMVDEYALATATC